MSASAKLRELGPPYDMTKTHSWIDVHGDGTMREVATMVALYDALPLIADVVEAAETFHAGPSDDYRNTDKERAENERNYWRVDRALTTLQEHLDALK